VDNNSEGSLLNLVNASNTILTFNEIFNWLKREESVSYKAYPDGKDSKGNQLYSIGYGHQIKPNESDLLKRTITEEEARQLFEKDIQTVRSEIKQLVRIPLNKNQQLAIISFRYNIGPEAFKNSTFLKKLNAYDFKGAALEFPRWRYTDNGTKVSQALVLRREREQALFLSTKFGYDIKVDPKNGKLPDTPENRKQKELLQKQLKEAEEILEELKKNFGKPIPPKTYNA
jgi:GH24 family phage-related lysozyme (muramidase)